MVSIALHPVQQERSFLLPLDVLNLVGSALILNFVASLYQTAEENHRLSTDVVVGFLKIPANHGHQSMNVELVLTSHPDLCGIRLWGAHPVAFF